VLNYFCHIVAKIELHPSTSIQHTIHMDPPIKRSKKSDKAKRTYELNGAYTAKHLRIAEALSEKKTLKPTKPR
jgi:hypothetical protein